MDINIKENPLWTAPGLGVLRIVGRTGANIKARLIPTKNGIADYIVDVKNGTTLQEYIFENIENSVKDDAGEKASAIPFVNVRMSNEILRETMKRLKELHKDDKMKLQQEMMALYKREKVNPMSGCLPILVQIPVFFAFYKILFVTLEMRHMPF